MTGYLFLQLKKKNKYKYSDRADAVTEKHQSSLLWSIDMFNHGEVPQQ